MDTVKQRSLKQNRYRFSVIVKYYQNWLNLNIIKYNEDNKTFSPISLLTPEDTDFYIKDVVWGLVERTKTHFGLITVVKPLRGSSVGKFEEYMERARAYAAQELHFEIPLPHECIDDLETQYADNLERI